MAYYDNPQRFQTPTATSAQQQAPTATASTATTAASRAVVGVALLASDKQIEFLERLGVERSVSQKMTVTKACEVIKFLLEHPKPTPKQVAFIRSNGLLSDDELESIDKADATQIISDFIHRQRGQ